MAKQKQKKQLTRAEEFDIMKLVLDKFLLLGTFIMGLGFYMIIDGSKTLSFSFLVLGAGAIILIIFAWILAKEYQFLSR
ncbi:MAG: hypothetical protein AB7V77_01160 [Candidatus Woesearchaeota archaeon]